LVLAGCSAQPTITAPTNQPASVAPASPTATPEPTPQWVRFDIVNGPRPVTVWMTSDRGADARVFDPGQRRTIFVPLFKGTDVWVYADGCIPLASIAWLPGTTPTTLVFTADPHGPGYLIDVQPGVSGTPVPESTLEPVGCSG
jgi:hypothetical protein